MTGKEVIIICIFINMLFYILYYCRVFFVLFSCKIHIPTRKKLLAKFEKYIFTECFFFYQINQIFVSSLCILIEIIISKCCSYRRLYSSIGKFHDGIYNFFKMPTSSYHRVCFFINTIKAELNFINKWSQFMYQFI